jgi:hypothetical protein
MNSSVFWVITPFILSKVNWSFWRTCCLHLQCWRVAQFYSSTIQMDATYSFETSLNFQWTTQRYIPEHGIRHNRCHEIFKSYILWATPPHTNWCSYICTIPVSYLCLIYLQDIFSYITHDQKSVGILLLTKNYINHMKHKCYGKIDCRWHQVAAG